MNHLADQQSLYLRQHADNPVDWYPWGEEALQRARDEQKPILLSIGYSACHWCHVMAHESFEDPQIAALMNEHFVNVKVDREERPDLDKIYQLAHQALTRRAGGWPLTMMLDPDNHLPFFGGTYFPPEPRHGMPAFPDLLERIGRFFSERREDLESQNQAMRRFLDEMSRVLPGPVPELDPVRLAVARIAEQFDAEVGGFGGAPKFPHPPNLELLLAAGPVVQDRTREELVTMVDRTLEGMARGGLFDQLGGGFFRYSVDAGWSIPHFEKMLYDNALLLPLYARRATETGSELFERAARLTVDWLQQQMGDRSGLFYASLDADSEGEEGRYYLWTPDQVREALDEDDAAVAIAAYGLDEPANFEEREWHLVRRRPLTAVAESRDIELETARSMLDVARRHLLQARSRRIPPGRDEKLITAWNALLIAGLARAGRWLAEPDWVVAARQAFDALLAGTAADGRLSAVVGSALPGYLDDHAYLLEAGLELLKSQWDEAVLQRSIQVADALIAYFEDRQDGAFFFTADDHETLIQRPRGFNDESTPAGNGVAVNALLRLGHLLGETRYLDAAERALRAAGPLLERAPHACSTMLRGLINWHQPPGQLIIRGGLQQPLAMPALEVYSVPDDSRLAQRFPLEGSFTAYLCEGRTCSPPMLDRGALLERVGVYLRP